MRRGILLPFVLCVVCVPAAACSSSSKPASTTTTTNVPVSALTTTTALATTTLPTPTGAPTTTAVGTPISRASAYIVSVDLAAHTITIDPMQFLTGPAAKTAYQHDHPDAQEGPPDDYYIVNPTKDHVVHSLAPDAVVRLVHVGGTDHTQPVAVPQSSLVGYQLLTLRPFWITTEQGTVTAVEEQFVP